VVVIESDDQTADSMRYMPRTTELVGGAGVSFPQSFVNYPLCCPSRATFLTGEYAHNHGVMNNVAPLGGFDRLDSTRTLPVWLQRAGYYTGLIGKYLNGYEGHRDDVPPLVPPGYNEWHGSTVTYQFYGYELNEGGTLVRYGTTPGDYSTDAYTGKAVDFIRRQAPQRQPFFLWLTYLAPHSGGPNPNPQPPRNCGETARPAPRHANALDGEPLPQPPSFDEPDVSDKPPGIADNPRLSPADLADEVRYYRCRAESLLAIDEGVEQVVAALRRSGELDDTLVVYTSDNGFMHGEHRQKTGKLVLYEESIRVPLLIRGPGFRGGRRVADLVGNADLAPTILEATGARAGLRLDGRPLQPLAAAPGRERGRELLVENLTYEAVRTRRYIYAEHRAGPSAGAKELYDLFVDPFELESLHADPAYDAVEAALARRLASLRGCSGASCRDLPELRLALIARNAPGRRCKAAPVVVAPRGEDLGRVRQAELYVDGDRVGVDRSRPFRRAVPYGLLRAGRRSKVRMRLTLIDGRRLTRDAAVRACGRAGAGRRA
jgi:arylsulfatase A-like enzyme